MSKEGGDKFTEKFNDMVGKHNFVKDGAIKLPPGFRFQPTEQEIVFQYLIRKTISCPLPATIIPELFNISKYSPRDLPGDWEQDKYFFSKKIIDSSMYGNGNRGGFNLTNNGGGYWKETGVDMQISPPATIRYCGNSRNSRSRREIAIMGMKKTLVYVKAGRRTRWIMHEYRLLHSLNPSTQRSWVQMGDWVLCHIFLRKTSCRKARRDGPMLGENQVKSVVSRQQKRLYDSINIEDSTSLSSCSSSSSSLSDSSVITEVSSSRIF